MKKSPGMVVIEVDRDYDEFDNLLGQHTWSEFLKKPAKEQMDKSSKVFYCTYNTGRLVEKHGPSATCRAPLCLLTHLSRRLETREY